MKITKLFLQKNDLITVWADTALFQQTLWVSSQSSLLSLISSRWNKWRPPDWQNSAIGYRAAAWIICLSAVQSSFLKILLFLMNKYFTRLIKTIRLWIKFVGYKSFDMQNHTRKIAVLQELQQLNTCDCLLSYSEAKLCESLYAPQNYTLMTNRIHILKKSPF